jgi:predicted outer membrane repeat protein
MAGAMEVASEQELRDALSSGGKILLTADIDAAGPFEVTQDTEFDGGGHYVDGGGTTHLFFGERIDVTIQNVTLRNAFNQVSDDEHFSRRSGAAIRISGGSGDQESVGSLTVINVTFDNNRIKETGPGDLRGGALYSFALPDTTIFGSTFTGNVGSNGGAVGGLGSSISIIDSVFAGNETNGPGAGGALEGHGGAISLDAVSQNEVTAYLNICGTRFDNNRSQNSGGALYLVAHEWTGTEVTIDQSVFSNNRTTSNSEGQGGAIFLMDDDKHDMGSNPQTNRAAITNSLFADNEVYNRGAGVWFWTAQGQLEVTNVTFVGNTTREPDGMGGGLALSNGPATVTNCTFADNYAEFHGGGIQAGGDVSLTLTNTLFYNNRSNRDGGWANFHTNREADVDGGGNMQWLNPEFEIDSNSNALVSPNALVEDARLADLADNGGSGMTMALPADSPAVDAGVVDAAPETDQRGLPRDGAPDIGAFELQAGG